MSSEQRKHPRFERVEETIYFTVNETEQGYDRTHYPGTVINASQNGLGMRVSFPHSPEDQVWLEGIGGVVKAQPGRVKWIKPAESEEELFYIGIEL